MRLHLTTFSLLGYASALLAFATVFFGVGDMSDRVGAGMVAIFIAALIWMASNGSRWAAYVFGLLMLLAAVVLLGAAWNGAPAWFRFGELFERLGPAEIGVNVVSLVCGVAALLVYFGGRDHPLGRP
jgi:cell division protein FtsW (lipid II flippase)